MLPLRAHQCKRGSVACTHAMCLCCSFKKKCVHLNTDLVIFIQKICPFNIKGVILYLIME